MDHSDILSKSQLILSGCLLVFSCVVAPLVCEPSLANTVMSDCIFYTLMFYEESKEVGTVTKKRCHCHQFLYIIHNTAWLACVKLLRTAEQMYGNVWKSLHGPVFLKPCSIMSHNFDITVILRTKVFTHWIKAKVNLSVNQIFISFYSLFFSNRGREWGSEVGVWHLFWLDKGVGYISLYQM